MKSFIKRYSSIIVFVVIMLLVAGYVISKRQGEKTEAIQISILAKRYNAVTDWKERFDEDGFKIGKGHRAVYTTDIEKTFIRNDGRPILIEGYVFDVTQIGDNNYLGIKAFAYPDLNFLLECQSQHTELVLAQPTDDGNSFAVVANVISVLRPAFETDALIEKADDETYSVIVEPGDQYILKGTCLDISYLGR